MILQSHVNLASGAVRRVNPVLQRPYRLRSLHLPVAPTDGSLTRNLNKTRVRLWT